MPQRLAARVKICSSYKERKYETLRIFMARA
jgi:hypothetical protein